MLKRLSSLILGFLLLGCGQRENAIGIFESGVSQGVNRNKKLEETSGVVASERFPGSLWAHNDSGHDPELFLLDSAGQTRTTFRISDAKNRDWEDIARLTIDSVSILLIGDIGDNNQRHSLKIIYCVPEPDAIDGVTELTPSRTLWIKLSGGYRDMEALMADPWSKNLYLVSKREHEVSVFEIAYPYPDDTAMVAPILQLPVSQITAADISPDGSEILMKNYNEVYYWKRHAGQRVTEALTAAPILLPYGREPQGESIAWAIDGSGYYTLSENGKGERGRLYFYARSHRRDSTMQPR